VLNETELLRGVRALSRRDADLRRIYKRYGPPPLWDREPGFATLVYIILEQQVSLASAKAAYARLEKACRQKVTPRRLLTIDDAQMKAIGFSRQKMGYARELAQAILAKQFLPEALVSMSDDAVRGELVKLKGIGRWTADIYLMECLLRPDVWPHGDLALAAAVEKVKGLPTRPSYDELNRMAEQWKPWRAVAARLFWHYYLSEKANR